MIKHGILQIPEDFLSAKNSNNILHGLRAAWC